jgi:hypothetical protein
VNILVTAFDSGGAEILAATVMACHSEVNWCIAAIKNSPQVNSFRRRGLSVDFELESASELEEVIHRCLPEYVFCGSGWSGHDLNLSNIAGNAGVPTVCFLDHWTSYRERFNYPDPSWKKNVPDFLVVGDKKALQLARGFGYSNVLCLRNYAFEESINDSFSTNGKQDCVLFCSTTVDALEEIHNVDPEHSSEREKEVLEDILLNFDVFEKLGLTKLIIRLHPAETNSHKLDFLKSRYTNVDISIEEALFRPLDAVLNISGLVVGLETMALINALLRGKKVVSIWGENNVLPLPKENIIRSFHDFDVECIVSGSDALDYLRFDSSMDLSNLLLEIKKILAENECKKRKV